MKSLGLTILPTNSKTDKIPSNMNKTQLDYFQVILRTQKAILIIDIAPDCLAGESNSTCQIQHT